jgi:acyl carrier protein
VTVAETSTSSPSPAPPSQAAVLAEISLMLAKVLDEYGLEEAEITMDTSLHDDLELESIDLVALAGLLATRYGHRVNVAEFLAEKSLDDIIGLRVGQLVEYVRTVLDDGSGES